jgi:hypothetical protein
MTDPQMTPVMPTTTDVARQIVSPTPSGTIGSGADTRPDSCAAKALACSSEMPMPLMFGSRTPLNVYLPNSDPEQNPHRKKLWLTSSDYPNALGVKGSYESRLAFTKHRFYGVAKPAPNDYLQGLLDTGKRMEPLALRLWNRLFNGRYFAVTSGLLLDMQRPDLFGATPDGLVFDSSTLRLIATLEIKNPQKRELAMSPEKIPQRYLMQILGQLMCVPVNRFFYLEYRSDTEFTSWEGEIDPDMKDACRTLLLAYKDLVDSHDIDSFPKRTKLIELPASSFRLKPAGPLVGDEEVGCPDP